MGFILVHSQDNVLLGLRAEVVKKKGCQETDDPDVKNDLVSELPIAKMFYFHSMTINIVRNRVQRDK